MKLILDKKGENCVVYCNKHEKYFIHTVDSIQNVENECEKKTA